MTNPSVALVSLGLGLVIAFGSTVADERVARGDGPPDAGAPQREPLDGPKLDAVLTDIALARKEMKTLRAAFTQERRITLLATSVKSRGELTFAEIGRAHV